jgi:hypothetical protein
MREPRAPVWPFRAIRPPNPRSSRRDHRRIESGALACGPLNYGNERLDYWLCSPSSLSLLRRTRFAHRSQRGCATRSPKGEAWWAWQPPYEAAFLEGFLGFIKILIQRVPTKIPTKLPRGRRSVCRRAVASRALVVHRVRSNCKGSSIAVVGKAFLKLVRHEPIDFRCHGGL